MGMADRARQAWRALKGYRVGPAVVAFASDEGREPPPSHYGEYQQLFAAIYACARLRADSLMQLPLRLYREAVNGERTEVQRGRTSDLLRRPNKFWGWKRLISTTEQTLCYYGRAFWVLERGPNGTGPVKELWWVRPDKMRVVPHPENYIAGYIYEENGQKIAFTPDEVIDFPYPNINDEFSAASPIAPIRLTVEAGRDAMRSNRNIFMNGNQMGGIVSPKEGSFGDDQFDELQELLNKRLKGVGNAHRVVLLSHAAQFSSVSMSPKDAEFPFLIKRADAEPAMVYFVAPELIGDHEHATYSNVEQALKSLWTLAIKPEAIFIADVITLQLLPKLGNEADVAEFDLSGVEVLQEDRGELVEQMKSLFSMGVPLNTLLQEYMPHLLPAGGKGYAWGNIWWAQTSLGPVIGTDPPRSAFAAEPASEAPPLPAPGAPPPTEDEGEPADLPKMLARALTIVSDMKALPAPAVRGVEAGSPEHEKAWKAFDRSASRREGKVRDGVAALFERQLDSVMARLGGSGKGASDAADDPFDLAAWVKRFRADMLPVFTNIFAEAGEDTLGTLDIAHAFDVKAPEAARFLEGRAQRFARQVNETTWETLRAALAQGLDEGESIPALRERVRAVFEDATKRRATVIARTEVIGASNAGSLIAVKQSGIEARKAWLASLDDRTRESHREAHRKYQRNPIGLDEDFRLDGGSGPAPGQIGAGSEDIDCRCTITYELD